MPADDLAEMATYSSSLVIIYNLGSTEGAHVSHYKAVMFVERQGEVVEANPGYLRKNYIIIRVPSKHKTIMSLRAVAEP